MRVRLHAWSVLSSETDHSVIGKEGNKLRKHKVFEACGFQGPRHDLKFEASARQFRASFA